MSFRKNYTVAIIDDDRDICEALVEVLELEGYQAVTFSNGREALEGLPDGADLILCDLMMPVMNGWEFLDAWANKQNKPKSIPIILFSASPDLAAIQHESVKALIPKPFDLDSLLRTIETCKTFTAA